MHKLQTITCDCGSDAWEAHIVETFGTRFGYSKRERKVLNFQCAGCGLTVDGYSKRGDSERFTQLRDQWFLTLAPMPQSPEEWVGRLISVNGEIQDAQGGDTDNLPFGFSFDGTHIIDPTMDGSLRGSVDPEKEYGDAFAASVFADPRNYKRD